MSRFIVIVLTAMVTMLAASAILELISGRSITEGASNKLGRGLICESPVQDFGNVTLRASEPLIHSFVLRNTTNRPARILKHVSSCSCAAIEVPVDAIEPGASVEVKVAVRWSGLVGLQEAKTLLVTDAGSGGTIILTVRGTLDAVPTISPAIIDFGPVDGGVHTRVAEVFFPDRSHPGEIASVKSTDDAVSATRLEQAASDSSSENSGRFAVTLDANRIHGSGTCTVTFETAGAPLTLYVRWRGRRTK